MRFRKLRIAWSVAWGILCLLVIVFWVRSYRWFDEFAFLVDNSQSVISIQSTWEGVLSLSWQDAGPGLATAYYSRLFNTQTREAVQPMGTPSKAGKFDSYFSPSQWYVAVPCWFLVITLGTLAGLPWLPLTGLRFSLRTLLIATTLIAGVLGLAVLSS
jgi:hypothetical protein